MPVGEIPCGAVGGAGGSQGTHELLIDVFLLIFKATLQESSRGDPAPFCCCPSPVLNGVGNAHLSPGASEGAGPQDRQTDTSTAAMRLSRKAPQIAEI